MVTYHVNPLSMLIYSHRDLNPLKTIVAGGIAGSLCVIIIPIDTLKSRYQTGEVI